MEAAGRPFGPPLSDAVSPCSPPEAWLIRRPLRPQDKHSIGHGGSFGTLSSADCYAKIRRFHFAQIAKLMDRLRGVQEGDGTMLDNTLVVSLSDAAESHHSRCREWPFVLIGDLGGRLRAGRYLRYPDYGRQGHRTMNSLYATLLQAAGARQETFGHRDPLLDGIDQKGPLAEFSARQPASEASEVHFRPMVAAEAVGFDKDVGHGLPSVEGSIMLSVETLLPSRMTSRIRIACCLAAALFVAPVARAAGEPWRMQVARLVGGEAADTIEAVAIQADGSIVVAGSGSGIPTPGAEPVALGGEGGFVIRLAADGTQAKSHAVLGMRVARLRVAPDDRLYLLGEVGGLVRGVADGWAVARLDKTGTKLEAACKVWSIKKGCRADFDVDFATGRIYAIGGGSLVCFGPDGSELWKAALPAHGEPRPFAVARDPKRGTIFVSGYGMTHTGKEPYKDPFLFAFDAQGTLVDTLWNPDPKKQCAAKHGGTGLMADGTGCFVDAVPGGRLLAVTYHDGGNAISTRNPRDPFQPLDPQVMAGVFQNGPGHGMKGAITTSVCYRIDPADPRALKVEKGTWMCAWLNNRTRANTLRMHTAAGDPQGNVFIVGASASDCPVQAPWFPWREKEYRGGGFLAVFDAGFRMVRCGTFPSIDLLAVAERNGVVVAAGRAKPHKEGDDDSAVKTTPQSGATAVAGDTDGYLVVLRRQ